jgi:hypothetical protein
LVGWLVGLTHSDLEFIVAWVGIRLTGHFLFQLFWFPSQLGEDWQYREKEEIERKPENGKYVN